MIRGVTYFRKSNEDEGESIDQQRKWSEEACRHHGVQVVREFEDQSVSGWDTARRSGFLAMIEFCEQQAKLGHPVEVVVCWHANRFSRADAVETSFFVQRLRLAGVTGMLTSSKWIYFNRSEDRMIFGLEQEATSHRFSVDLSAVLKRGKRAKASKGLWTGGRPPYGYRVEGQRFVIDEATADVARLIFESYASGRYGLRALGEMLIGRGIHSPASNGLWAGATLRHILKNPVYLGNLISNRKTDNSFLGAVNVPVSPVTGKRKRYTHNAEGDWVVATGSHPALISQELFDRVQARFASNRRRTSPTKAFILSGLMKCGECQGTMIGRSVRDKRYYVCARYLAFGSSSGCHHNAVQEMPLVTAVANKLADAYFNPATMAALRDEIRRQEQAPRPDERRKFLTTRMGELDGQVKAAAHRLMTVSEDHVKDCEEALSGLKREIEGHRKELEALELATVPTEDLDTRIESILTRMTRFRELLTADPVGANVVLGEMIERVVLYFDNDSKVKRCRFARGAIYLGESCRLERPEPPLFSGSGRRLRR